MKLSHALSSLLLLLATSVVLAKTQKLPEVSEDGLHLLPDSKMAIVYAEPGADLAQYQRVRLLDAYVAFKKNWARNQRSNSAIPLRVTSADMEKIKKTLAEEFDGVFREALEKGGYKVVDENADDVLLVRPAIINLDVNAPDTPRAGMSRTYTSSAGEMTLYIELYDSVTGDLLAKALDRRVDNAGGSGYYTWTNSVTNRSAGRRILNGWAAILLDALNEAKQ
ncbi:MAG: DUF3313 domain-containing protein [Xanthomonadales bacterium]|jgi:hypothetical protein|nr:DUF3313 domain-containing protein [Xanthomonadales bacterium]MDH4000928.1 DUF3313 domain-containing protein [Xanthomonadales bacterium]